MKKFQNLKAEKRMILISKARGSAGGCCRAVSLGWRPRQGHGSNVVVDVVVAVLGNSKNEEIPKFETRKKENLC